MLEVALDSGEKLPADIVILSIGVRPANKLAIEAGIETGKRGGIVVNEYLHTSAPDFYAVGDAIEYPLSYHRRAMDELSCRPCKPPGTHSCRQYGIWR